MIDLHAHSTASDGTDTPSELVSKAKALGLTAIALTDHDTLEGLPEAELAAKKFGVELVPGVELSIEDGDDRRFHLLSYFFDHENSALNEVLLTVRQWREDRNGLMVGRAQAAGIDLTIEDVRAEAGPDSHVLGRPHFAAALIKKGLVSTIQEAFDKYLATGRPINVPKPSLSPGKAADLIHAAGGVTVVAHPGLIKWAEQGTLLQYLRELKDAGAIDGIECYYPRHTESQAEVFLALARDADLLVTGGSDYHGANKSDIQLGVIWQGKALPEIILDRLRHASSHGSSAVPISA